MSSQTPGRRDERTGAGARQEDRKKVAGRPSERRKVSGRTVAKRRPSARLRAARGKAGDPGSPAQGKSNEEHVLTATLPNKHGLHMRPAKHLVELANSFPCEITLVAKGQDVDAKSILSVIGLGAECGDEIEIRTRGPRAKEAAGAVAELLTSLAEMKGESKGKKAK
ncbi:MAG: HPr family phosphocarrier protein [Planctomycetota bacterium]